MEKPNVTTSLPVGIMPTMIRMLERIHGLWTVSEETSEQLLSNWIYKKCLQADIIPRFLKFRVPENGCFEPTVVHNFQRNLLKVELSKAKKTKETHSNIIETKRTLLKNLAPINLIPSIVFHTRQTVKQTRLNVQKTRKKKLESLSKQQQRPLFDVHDTVKSILTSKQIICW